MEIITCKLILNTVRPMLKRPLKNILYHIRMPTREEGQHPSFCQEGRYGRFPMKNGHYYCANMDPYSTPRSQLLPQLANCNCNNLMEFISVMQTPPEIDFQKAKEMLDWWANIKAEEEIHDQAYDPERVKIHGPDSTAAHFFIDRQASVKLIGCNEWLVGGLPSLTRCTNGYFVQAGRDEKDYLVEAIDCKNFHFNGIRYEGLLYLSGLKHLKYLSLENQKNIDVFCLDRIAGQNGGTIEYLDISSCELDRESVVALDRMEALKEVIIADPGRNAELTSTLIEWKRKKPYLSILMKKISHRPRTAPRFNPRYLVSRSRWYRGRSPATRL